MKVLLVTVGDIGGPANQVSFLYEELARKQISVKLVVIGSPSSNSQFNQLMASALYLPRSLSTIPKLRTFIRKNDFNVVHSTLTLADFFVALSKYNLRHIKHVSTLRVAPAAHLSNHTLGSLVIYLTHLAISMTGVTNIACSKAVLSQSRYFPIIKYYVDNCICKRKSYRNESVKIREKLNIVIIGWLNKRKNVDASIQLALDILDKVDCQIRGNIYIIGEGVDSVRLLRTYSDTKYVIFTGYLNDHSAYLNKASLHISMSKREGMPNTVLETLSFGIFNLLSDIPEHRYIADKLGQGIEIVPGYLSDEWYQLIIEKISAQSKSRFRQVLSSETIACFSCEKTADKYLRIYNE